MGLISRVSSRTYRFFIPHKTSQKKILKMVFSKFIEIGRIVFVPNSAEIYAIVDVVNAKHVLVDSPNGKRQVINLNRIQLTKFKCEFFHGAKTKNVKAAWAAVDIDAKWAASNWAKKLAKKSLRANATDFDRFKVMKLKQARRQIVNAAVAKQ